MMTSALRTGHGVLRSLHHSPTSITRSNHLALRLRLAAPQTPHSALHRRPATTSHTHANITTRQFWLSRPHWRRASINTLRCLLGCTVGDFSTMWYLQTLQQAPAMSTTMGLSMAAGVMTSFTLETVVLRLGRDGMATWLVAAKTAAGMSLVSMLAMETVQNVVDWHLTGGKVELADWRFWRAAGLAMAAGFLAPLPWNYVRLRRWGRTCH